MSFFYIQLTHSLVFDCAVIGVYDKEQVTEMVTAFIQLPEDVQGNKPEEEIKQELQAFVDSQVLDYQRIRGGIYIVDDLPRTPGGKIQKRFLQQMYMPTAQ